MKAMMIAKIKMTTMVCAAVLVVGMSVDMGTSSAQAASGAGTLPHGDAPRIVSWSNSKTKDQKTVFRAKPGERVTFSVKAEGAEKYEWKINTEIRKGALGPTWYRRRHPKKYEWREFKVQESARGNSFTWTVPGKGIWKIRVVAANTAHEKRADELIASCAKYWSKWKKDGNDEWRRWMREALVPSGARKEWIVSTSLVKVKPGESIQKAIESLPSEGGIVKLLPGTHVVNETIVIKRNNLAVTGERSAIVRHDDKQRRSRCFDVPRGGYHGITFKGFSTTSAYTASHLHRTIFSADEVTDFTVEDINDSSRSYHLVGVHSSQQDPRFSRNIFYRDNTSTGAADLCALFAENVHFVHNTIKKGVTTCIDLNRNLTHAFVYYNYASYPVNSPVRGHGAVYTHIYDNVFVGGHGSVSDDGLRRCIIENNTMRGATRHGAIDIVPQYPLRDTIYRHNRIYDCAHGVYTRQYPKGFQKKISNPTIVNNTIYNCTGDGIHMTSHYVRLNIRNNIIVNNGGYGINYVETKEPRVIRNNNVWKNARGNYNNTSAGKGDISADPLFADPEKGDFHLGSKAGRWDPKTKKWVKDRAHSPCIDAGDPEADCSMEPKPNGDRVNVGAHGNTREASKSAR